jgi:hypothetical protein
MTLQHSIYIFIKDFAILFGGVVLGWCLRPTDEEDHCDYCGSENIERLGYHCDDCNKFF